MLFDDLTTTIVTFDNLYGHQVKHQGQGQSSSRGTTQTIPITPSHADQHRKPTALRMASMSIEGKGTSKKHIL